jgi:CBS domain-containing protein
MQVRQIMTRSLETVPSDISLREAASKMASEDIGFLPVLDEGELVGVITDRDIIVRAVSKGLDPERTTVEEAMTEDIVSVSEHSELEQASDLMEGRHIRRLVVTDEDDIPVGVVSIDKIAFYLGQGARNSKAFSKELESAAGESPKGSLSPGGTAQGSTRPRRAASDQGDVSQPRSAESGIGHDLDRRLFEGDWWRRRD